MPSDDRLPHPDRAAVGAPDAEHDPVRRRRRTIAVWNTRATRLGWSSFGLAIALFALAVVTEATSTLVPWIIASLVVGCVVLAPAIVIGYAVKAADRDDRERGL